MDRREAGEPDDGRNLKDCTAVAQTSPRTLAPLFLLETGLSFGVGASSSFFCGGSRNFLRFIDFLDLVFVLEVDPDTLKQRPASRLEHQFGGRPIERDLVLRLHATKEDIPEVTSSSTPPRRLTTSWMRF